MQKRVILAFFVAVFIIVGLMPALSMVWHSFYVDGQWSLAAYRQVLNSTYQWRLFGKSLLLASLVTALSLIVGLPLAIVLQKSDLYLRRVFTLLLVVPLLLPPYIGALSWYYLLGRQGYLAQIFGTNIAELTSSLLFGLPGCVLVLFAAFLPIPMLLIMLALRSIDPRIEQAARLDARWSGILKAISLPLIRPVILLSALLVFLLSFGEFGVPNFLHYSVFAFESFVQFSAFYNFAAATAAALPLLVVALLLWSIEARLNQSQDLQLSPATNKQEQADIILGFWQKPIFVLLLMLAMTTTIGPVLVLVLRAENFSYYLLALDKAADSLWRSILYAAIAATLLSLLGYMLAYLIHNKIGRFWRELDLLTVFLLMLPSTVLGIGLIQLWNRPLGNIVYATPAIIIIGYLAKYTALSSRISIAQLAMIPAPMEQAAELAGASWLQRMFYVVIPLSKRGIIIAWIVAYIFSFRDTGISMLVYPPGYDTLPLRIFTLMANGDAAMVAALSVIMIVAVLIPAGLLWVLTRIYN